MPVDPATPALSTMWTVQPRFERDLPAFLARAAELGFGAVEVNHSMDAQQVRAVLDSGALPVTAVHAPAPLESTDAGVENRDLNLASLDEQERNLALDFHHRTIDIATEALEMFAAMLGTAASNLALSLGALGGVYIGGGIVPRLGAAFPSARFRARFEDKGRFGRYLAAIPSYVITRPEPALLGLAAIVRAAPA